MNAGIQSGILWRIWAVFLLCFPLPFPLLAAESAIQVNAAPSISSVQADFQQEKHLKMLVRPIISQGSLYFQAPASLRWEYRSPVPSILLMHNDSLKKYVERDGILQEAQGLPISSMQVVMAEISKWLDGRFTENTMFTVTYPKASQVLLTPKKGMLEGIIEEIELHLADHKGGLKAVIIREGTDGYTHMTFTNRQLNQKLPATLFTRP